MFISTVVVSCGHVATGNKSFVRAQKGTHVFTWRTCAKLIFGRFIFCSSRVIYLLLPIASEMKERSFVQTVCGQNGRRSKNEELKSIPVLKNRKTTPSDQCDTKSSVPNECSALKSQFHIRTLKVLW